jgi:hypothetical protein
VGVHYVFQASRPLSRVCIRDVVFPMCALSLRLLVSFL